MPMDRRNTKIKNECVQDHKLGHIEAKIEEHSKILDDIHKDKKYYHQRIDDVENYNVGCEIKHGDSFQKHDKHTEQLDKLVEIFGSFKNEFSQIKWAVIGGSMVFMSCLAFFIFLIKDLPEILEKLLPIL
jgi:hypothetical protein